MELKIKREDDIIWVSIDSIMMKSYNFNQAKKLQKDLYIFQDNLSNIIRKMDGEVIAKRLNPISIVTKAKSFESSKPDDISFKIEKKYK